MWLLCHHTGIHSYQTYVTGMSIFRFSAEFRFFFFFTFRFFKNDFPRFLKNHTPQKLFFRLPTPPLSTVRRALVNSRWRHGLPVCASSVSGRSSKVPISTGHSKSDAHGHAVCWRTACAALTRRRGGWWFIELQHLHPLLFHPHHFTHTHTLSLPLPLSLSLSLSLSVCLSLSLSHCQLPAAAISR